MRQILLSGAMLAFALGAGATVTHTTSFVGEFGDYVVPAGWTMIGHDATPTGDFANYFDEYTPANCYTVLSAATLAPTAFSPSQFTDGSKSDEWLITPEFTVGKDAELLCFTVAVSGNNIKNNYAVYLSEGGEGTKDDFRQTQLLKTALQGNGGINTVTRRIVLEGYAGKSVRLALVNLDNSSGIVGFNGISVAPYFLSVDDEEALENMILDGTESKMEFKMKVSTPFKVPGLKAVLHLENGEEYTYEYAGNITQGMFTTVSPVFSGIDFKGEAQVNYTVTVTLNDESLEPTYITGTLINAERIYPPVVLAEEFTGTWCGYCPLGAAYLSYYSDYYDGTRADGARFFMAAVHDGDPMQAPATYYNPAMSLAQKYGFQGYPSAMLNRRVVLHPASIDIDALMSGKTYGRIALKRADYDDNTRTMTLTCAPRISFNSPGLGLGISAIVIENELSGKNSQWSQTNNFGNFTSKDIVEQLGAEMLPYMEIYVNRPGQQVVPYTQMVYNEVVRDVFPSYAGKPLEGAWTADTERTETLQFTMPISVVDEANTAIIVVLSNTLTGEVISADRVNAADYGKELSGVQGVADCAGAPRLGIENGILSVESDSEGYVEIFGADGSLVVRAEVAAGFSSFELPEGLSIVNVANAAGRTTLKTVK
ncbi:MAG: choice-of-anchor J domain-containing protein [Muribaculaceae bacterium]|nr:choice-of-anchor J domain-containing protein [Muribaculaceae bacterium]